MIAFDVETPNHMNHRMSAIGITVIEDGTITDEYYSLVDPETHFDYFNTRLTGISEDTVRDAPTFPEVWERIEPMMSGGILVAHNAVFDLHIADLPGGEQCVVLFVHVIRSFYILGLSGPWVTFPPGHGSPGR